MKRLTKIAMIVLGVFLFWIGQTWAGGINRIITPNDSLLSGMAPYYSNPAFLSQEPNLAQAGADYISASFDYKDAAGGGHSSEKENYFVPFAGASCSLSDRTAIGFGIVTPYVLGSNFKDEFGMFSKIGLTDFSLALSHRLFDNFFIGAALKIGCGQVKLSQPYYWLGRLDSEADGRGYSGQVGVLWTPADWLKVGFSHQGKTKVELNGETEFVSGSGNISDDFTADFYFPGRYSLDIRTQFDRLALNANITWFDYSSCDKVKMNYENWADDELTLDWENNTYYGLGAEYALSDFWKLRAGVAYQDAVIPDTTISPATPDMDGWCVSGGVGFRKGNFGADVGYLEVLADERSVSAQYAGAGEYDADVNIISASASWFF